ncbi:DUF5060 domain-containing protein [Nibrella viscosa]|uniref:DUF5060 domain-containing protein n=1 Tax=Nibrella viscosa TaxID=1084524 RepID=UPI0031E74479
MEVYDYAEATLRLPAFRSGNPFTDQPLTGTFRHESGESVQVDGFCDAPDGLLHRIRFMPARHLPVHHPGQYSGKPIMWDVTNDRVVDILDRAKPSVAQLSRRYVVRAAESWLR